MDHAEQVRRAHEYISALEEERRKIQVFHRELPLCLQLVTEAIDNYKQLMMTESVYPSRSECEETSNDSPVLEEFIPLKRCSSSEEEKSKEKDDESGKKPDWMKSVQLWNPSPDPPPKEDQPPKPSIIETKKSNGAFHPFEKEKPTMAMTPMSAYSASSTAEKCSSGRGGEEKEGQSNRKARRCWSPELHRRFLHALQQLGGSHAATPKQIRELMKVDGLTNDEVKSHLQMIITWVVAPTLSIHAEKARITWEPVDAPVFFRVFVKLDDLMLRCTQSTESYGSPSFIG